MSKKKSDKEEKRPGINRFWIILLGLFLLVGILYFNIAEPKELVKVNDSCGDGTLFGRCSFTKPYYCNNGSLEINYSCGCPEFFDEMADGSCRSDYQTGGKPLSLNYILRGKKDFVNLEVYRGLNDYLSELPRNIYSDGQEVTRKDFKENFIGEEVQDVFLSELVIKIQNITSDKIDQARIAVSLVQNIPYGFSNKTSQFSNSVLIHSRYPYEVLYDEKGICGEKSALLLFLLKKLDYESGFFYYPIENHEAVWIGCEEKERCFVETTTPSIITFDNGYYSWFGYLSSDPQSFKISSGAKLPVIYEYEDAEKWTKYRSKILDGNKLNYFQKKQYESLKLNYGL